MKGSLTILEVLDKIKSSSSLTKKDNIIVSQPFVGPTEYFVKEEDGSWSSYIMNEIKFEPCNNTIGTYSLDFLLKTSDSFLSNINDLINGKIVISQGKMINYYKREIDSSWTKYDCKINKVSI